MARNDDASHYTSERLISKIQRTHFRVPVRSQYVKLPFRKFVLGLLIQSSSSSLRHWQLRSLISAENKHNLFYPGGVGSRQVQRLNTQARSCETIKHLTFAPRCLVAENGWLCCGSETGEFVAIRLEGEGGRAVESPQNPSLDPSSGDAATMSPEEAALSMLTSAAQQTSKVTAKSMKLAKERVNCITLWFPPPQGQGLPIGRCAYTEPVAVLANNDRTVTLVSLSDFEQKEMTEPLDVIRYPDFVNRAIISPDGRLMIAILDDPYLYVHQRVGASPGRWELRQRILLKSQKKDDKTDSRGSFAASFSTSGTYLAVGTQHGTISIFNATQLTDETVDPLITTFQSSRPNSGPGAIRDMAFCPGPYDLLAWTEDRGRVGIADVRHNFMVRQIIDLNKEAEYEHINIFDTQTIDPRLLETRMTRGEPSQPPLSAANFFSAQMLHQPLTPAETRVLEAIQSERRRRERPNPPFSEDRGNGGAGGATGWIGGTGAAATATSSFTTRARQNPNQIPNDLINVYRDHRERAQERVRSARQLMRENGPGSGGRAEQRWIDRINETMAALRDQRDRQDSSYLSVLEILQSRERSAADGTAIDERPILPPVVSQVGSRWEESAVRGTLAPDHGVFEVPPSPDNTSGLSWSQDGTILITLSFVGAQNGIYQLRVDIPARQFHNSIILR
ncbi:wd domain containing [Trichoderma arundinaceum]|uniref:Wd domain containing n=1 Tax=Trichoderma arundinaceum TaxID=490622 RepID=A0A395N9Y2_TRIAR|nr:wd domain containing [Trichoderma arundinaceum]